MGGSRGLSGGSISGWIGAGKGGSISGASGGRVVAGCPGSGIRIIHMRWRGVHVEFQQRVRRFLRADSSQRRRRPSTNAAATASNKVSRPAPRVVLQPPAFDASRPLELDENKPLLKASSASFNEIV